MKNKVTVTVPYVTNTGEEKEYKFEIGFVSNRILAEYGEVARTIKEVQDNWISLNKEANKIAEGKIKESESKYTPEQMDEIQVNITRLASPEFFQKRYDLIKRLLNMNGYNEGEFLKEEFWWDNVEPANIVKFLNQAVYKDIEKKN